MYRMLTDGNANTNSRDINRDAAFELLTIDNGYAFTALLPDNQAIKTYKIIISNFDKFTKDQLDVLRSPNYPLRATYLKQGGDPKAGADVVGKEPTAEGSGSSSKGEVLKAAQAGVAQGSKRPAPAPAAKAEPEKKA